MENVIREQMYTTLDTSQDMIVGLYSGQDSSNFTQSQLRRALTNSQMHLIVDMEEVIAGREPQLHPWSYEDQWTRVLLQRAADERRFEQCPHVVYG